MLVGWTLLVAVIAISAQAMAARDRAKELEHEIERHQRTIDRLAAELAQIDCARTHAPLCIGCNVELGLVVVEEGMNGTQVPLRPFLPAPAPTPRVVELPSARARIVRRMLRW
jgi:hypothetical protein